MPVQQVLLLAMSKMLSGICVAGFTPERDPATGLRWVRPVREFDTLLPGDMTGAGGRLMQCGDVVELNLLSPRPAAPHTEDWVADFVRCRPRLARRLQAQRRASFLAQHLDPAPEQVLVHHTRSLCLVQPEHVQAHFSLDTYSGKYEARMSIVLPDDAQPLQAAGPRGIPVTDLKWRAWGRTWFGQGAQSLSPGGKLTFDADELQRRLHIQAFYLTLGLSRNWQGNYWPLVVGVHVVPDYESAVDVGCL